MTSFTVRFESIDLLEIDRAINSDKVMKAFAPYRRSQFSQQIALGVNPYGEAIAPLTPRYAKRKQAKYGRKPIRSASGATVKSYRSRVVGGQLVEEIGGAAAFHQQGGKNLPQRLYLPTQERGFSAADQERLLVLAVKEVERAFRRAKR